MMLNRRLILSLAVAAGAWRVVRLLLALTRTRARFVFDQTGRYGLLRRLAIELGMSSLISISEVALAVGMPRLLLGSLRILRPWAPTSAHTHAQVQRIADIPYGRHAQHTLDVYLPAQAFKEAFPHVVIFVHGGAWAWHSKSRFALVGAHMCTDLSVPVCVMNYRRYPTGCCDEMTEDVEAAVEWATRWFPRSRIILTGHSAGAHLCVLAAVRWAARLAERDRTGAGNGDVTGDHAWRRVDAIVAAAGVYDIADHYVHEASRRVELLPANVFGSVGVLDGVARISPMAPAMNGAAEFARHSPARILEDAPLLCRMLPKLLLLHGDEDTTVPPASSERLLKAVHAGGGDVSLQVLPRIGHVEWLLEVMTAPAYAQTVTAPEDIAMAAPSPKVADDDAVNTTNAVLPPAEIAHARHHAARGAHAARDAYYSALVRCFVEPPRLASSDTRR